MVVLVLLLISVAWVGRLTYQEGMKTELTKRNGEAWVAWIGKAAAERGEEGFEPAVCAKGILPAEVAQAKREPGSAGAASALAAAPELARARIWGPCFKALTEKGGAMAALENPFTKTPFQVVAKCNIADRRLAGALVLEKVTPPPPGSAGATITSPLVDADPIDQTLSIRVVVCDEGAYPIRVADVNF